MAIKRDAALALEEYNKVYKPLYDAFIANPNMSPDELEARFRGMNLERTREMMRHNELFVGSIAEAIKATNELVISAVKTARDVHGARFEAVVDLGAGFGHDLHVLHENFDDKIRYIGGDTSMYGVALGNRAYVGHIGMHPFDYYEASGYAIIPDDVPCLVMTHHSIEQIPDYMPVFKNLLKSKSVVEVVHMEPFGENSDWAEKYDYNRNMMAILTEAHDSGAVEVLDVERRVFGVNPENPTSIVWWRPR